MLEWFSDIGEYLGDFVPAERLLEVVSLLERQFTVFDLVAMCDEDILQIVIMLEKKLSFKKKYLFRYLQAAQYIHSECQTFADKRSVKVKATGNIQTQRMMLCQLCSLSLFCCKSFVASALHWTECMGRGVTQNIALCRFL